MNTMTPSSLQHKEKRFVCQGCGLVTRKWSGQCPGCEAWNTLEPSPVAAASPAAPEAASALLPEVIQHQLQRQATGSAEMDRVLGGGLVPGQAVLIGGDPGIGKSTLLLQLAGRMAATATTLYVSGEESLEQVAQRASRLGLRQAPVHLLACTHLETVLARCQTVQPACMVVDSIQTMVSDQQPSGAGSVLQLRGCTAALVELAKTTGCMLFLVGHVTKEGILAGPKVLEHMVDTVLSFEADPSGRLRLLRATKNRFGAIHELAVFAMTERGMRDVHNPSAIFLARPVAVGSGSVTTTLREGSRTLMVEFQALCDACAHGNPRRLALGMDPGRLAMLLAVLSRHGGLSVHQYDCFINLVGGLRAAETAPDLACAMAIASSLRAKVIPDHVVVFGELGLAGEVRPVHAGAERLMEAAKHGMRLAIIPAANLPKNPPKGLEIKPVERLGQALELLEEWS